MSIRTVPLLALPLVACATATPVVPQGDGGGSAPYQALGTEPFWGLRIDRNVMTFEGLERPNVEVRTPPMQLHSGVRRYVTRRLRVEITPDACSDGMSDRTYADTVSVVVDGTRLNGCGGRILRQELLAGTNWRIVGIDGARIDAAQGYSIAFTADRVSGQAGCNRFNGSYDDRRANEIRFSPLATTRMACPPPRMAHEQAVLRILSGGVRIAENDLTSMVLTGSGGTLRLELGR
jgi:heat shock protein HslJ